MIVAPCFVFRESASEESGSVMNLTDPDNAPANATATESTWPGSGRLMGGPERSH